jgi:hypothetical protein
MIHHSNSRYKPLYIHQLSLTLAILDHDEPLSTILGRSAVAAVIAAILRAGKPWTFQQILWEQVRVTT